MATHAPTSPQRSQWLFACPLHRRDARAPQAHSPDAALGQWHHGELCERRPAPNDFAQKIRYPFFELPVCLLCPCGEPAVRREPVNGD